MPKIYAAHAWKHSILVWQLGSSSPLLQSSTTKLFSTDLEPTWQDSFRSQSSRMNNALSKIWHPGSVTVTSSSWSAAEKVKQPDALETEFWNSDSEVIRSWLEIRCSCCGCCCFQVRSGCWWLLRSCPGAPKWPWNILHWRTQIRIYIGVGFLQLDRFKGKFGSFLIFKRLFKLCCLCI